MLPLPWSARASAGERRVSSRRTQHEAWRLLSCYASQPVVAENDVRVALHAKLHRDEAVSTCRLPTRNTQLVTSQAPALRVPAAPGRVYRRPLSLPVPARQVRLGRPGGVSGAAALDWEPLKPGRPGCRRVAGPGDPDPTSVWDRVAGRTATCRCGLAAAENPNCAFFRSLASDSDSEIAVISRRSRWTL